MAGRLTGRFPPAARYVQPVQGRDVASGIPAGRHRPGSALAGSYAEGIAQPTFFDLYGFFPGNFVGIRRSNRKARAGSRDRFASFAAAVQASLTAYRQRLHDEIVDVFDFTTFLSSAENRDGTSRRWESRWMSPGRLARSSASRPITLSQGDPTRRCRRPPAPGAAPAETQRLGIPRRGFGAMELRRVGRLRRLPPRSRGGLSLRCGAARPYWLAGARIAYAVRPGIELFARGSNLFDTRYEDSGYRTEGRGVFVGIRLADRRSSP